MTKDVSLSRFPEFPLWNRLRLAHNWLPSGALDILDAGCAWGYGTRFFVGPGRNVFGVDSNPEFIGVAKSRYPRIAFSTEDLEVLSLPDQSIDYVVCGDVLEHVTDPVASLDQLHRVLRPGGHLFLSTPHRGLFGFLDPYNYGRSLRKYFPAIYSRLVPSTTWRKGMSLGEEHRHYSEQDLCTLLGTSRFRQGYEVAKRFKSGLLLYPLELNTGVILERLLPQRPRAIAALPLQALAELDYWIPFGPASFNIALLVKKRALTET